MEIRLLGPLEVAGAADLGGRRQRSLLGILLLAHGSTVSVDRLIDGVWGDEPPASGRHLVQVYVSALRGVLPPSLSLRTEPPGYRLAVDPELVDAARFERLVAAARGQDEPPEALELYDEALGLWRGDALAGLNVFGVAAASARRLDSLRLTVIEERIDAALAVGRHRELVPELERLTAAEPLRERFTLQLMLALYRSGRQADALALYRSVRRRFADELGVEPGPELRALERAVLEHDESLTPPGLTLDAPRVERPPRRHRRRGMVAAAVVVVATAALVAWAMWPAATVRLRANSVGLLVDGRVTASRPLPGPPETAAAGSQSLWVVDGSSRLLELDPHGRIERSFAIRGQPRILAVDRASVWIGSSFDGTLTRVASPGGHESARRLDPRSEGRLAMTNGFGSLWVASQDGVLVRAGPEDGRVLARIRLPALPEVLAPGFGSIWVGSRSREEVARIDPHTNRIVRRIPIGGMVSGLAVGADRIWAVTPANGRVWSIDPARNDVASGTALPLPGEPDRVAVTDGLVWIGSTAGSTLVALSAATRQVVRTIQLPAPVAALVADGPRLWIALT